MSTNDTRDLESRHDAIEATELYSELAAAAPFARFDAKATLAGEYENLRVTEAADE